MIDIKRNGNNLQINEIDMWNMINISIADYMEMHSIDITEDEAREIIEFLKEQLGE